MPEILHDFMINAPPAHVFRGVTTPEGLDEYCWAMYLRILTPHIEIGEPVPYEKRLDA